MATIPIVLSKDKQKLLETKGNILVLGGPGSGKTTIALLKANEIINGGLKRGQRILFLSFARATVTRVQEQAKSLLLRDIRKDLEINTYHGFTWNILKSHGYLLNNGNALRLLPPPQSSARFAGVEKADRTKEKVKLYKKEGLVDFELFAGLAAELLNRSKSLTEIISNAYPIIILDEFQDTDNNEWLLIQALGVKCRLIVLADLEQRIYEFRGADPARISEFIKAFDPIQFDFGTENNRSNGTDIVKFGNDLLAGKNKTTKYKNVNVVKYQQLSGAGLHMTLKTEVLAACKRLNSGSNWSLALLVPTKKLILTVSDYMASSQRIANNRRLPIIPHDVALETAGPSLAAILISRLLERELSDRDLQYALINDLVEHMRGRNGDTGPSQASLVLSAALKGFADTGIIKGSNRQSIAADALRIARACIQTKFSGDPGNDWITVRDILSKSSCEVFQQVATDAKYLRLLRKGAVLNAGLANLWRKKANYEGARSLVRSALAQEHFSVSTTVWKGIHIMTMHKAKGKEFDEVIIYEGLHNGRIVWENSDRNSFSQAQLALRVAITRARLHVTIVTPVIKPCPLL